MRREHSNSMRQIGALLSLVATACNTSEIPRRTASAQMAGNPIANATSSASVPLSTTLVGAVGGATGDGHASKPVSAIIQPTRLIELPGGIFEIGSNKLTDYERPPHKVKIAPFGIEATEVTVAQFKSCVEHGVCSEAADTTKPLGDSREQVEWAALLARGCNGKAAILANHPITCVDWEQAATYCRWVGRRLPTEEEWEFAAREPDGRFWVWGNTEDASAANVRDASLTTARRGSPFTNEHDDGFAFTAPVGSFPRDSSVHGVKDLMGNVAEWTSSESGRYPKHVVVPFRRIVRGDSWDGYGSSGGIARFDTDPSWQSGDTGFRCARDTGPSTSVAVPLATKVVPSGFCKNDKDCVSKKEACWEYKCTPCRQVCKNEIRQAALDHADGQYPCESADSSCRQTQREINDANSLMARVAYATCLAEKCGDETELNKLPKN